MKTFLGHIEGTFGLENISKTGIADFGDWPE